MYAVIMAGGAGERFWPKSTKRTPKQLLNLVGEGTLLSKTISRILPKISPENIFIVTNELQKKELWHQVIDFASIPSQNILIEPIGRNTLPCVGLAALHIKRIDPEGVMCVLPADHYIENEPHFLTLLSAAEKFLKTKDQRIARYSQSQFSSIVTLGIKPTYPATGYGYLKLGERILKIEGIDVFEVQEFIEKPDTKKAKEFLLNSNYLWNSGIFLWRTSTILKLIEKFTPSIFNHLEQIEAKIGRPEEWDVIREAYSKMSSVSIDYGVMEKADNVVAIVADIGWSDLGSWASMERIWEKDDFFNARKGKHIGIDTEGCIIYGPNKLVATIGVKDHIVVATEDVVLVCPKGRAEEVKNIVEKLKKFGLNEYL